MKLARALIAVCALAAGCSDYDAGPNVATSIEFAALPFPAVVAGDTLRDTSGIVAPLSARVFNSGNEEIVGAPVRYFDLAGVVAVDSITGVVRAVAANDTSARIIAVIGTLQSPPLRLSVVPRPDSATQSGVIDTLRYSVLDSTQNLSGELAVRVAHRGATGDVPVRDWIVSFALETPSDSTLARIVGDNDRRSSADTTTAAGIASRRVRLSPGGLTSPSDSVVVLARVRYRDSHVAGSPVRLVLHVRPRAP